MKVEVLAFGIAKDIFGKGVAHIDLEDAALVLNLKESLEQRYPKLKELASYMIAVNDEYAEDSWILKETDEVAIIPPVSGG